MFARGKNVKKSVALVQTARPSRIRRDPVRAAPARPAKPAWWRSEEWEIRLSLGGIGAFALAIFIITLGIFQHGLG